MNWISVKDRLPSKKSKPDFDGDEFSETVLAWGGRQAHLGCYDHEHKSWDFTEYGLDESRITHWCEIAPPVD